MAYTKIHPIKCTVDKAISYITNPEKTDEKLLVSSFACSEETAFLEFEATRNKYKYSGKNLAYHCIQSFSPNEVTPEQAHQIGIQTADELLKGKYEYVISTHTNCGHIHNHIIICGVNFENGLSFGTEHDRKNNPAWKQLRKISDDICLENKLSVISLPEKGYGKCYYEWLQEQRNSSYKSKLKHAIDNCILAADSYDDFLKKMQNDMKYEYKIRGNSLSFRAEEQERFTRCSRKSLGWYYEPEQIKKRIERQVKKRSARLTKETGFYQVHDENAVGLNRWAALKNMQEASRLLNMLSDYCIGSAEQLEEKILEHYDQKLDMITELNSYEISIREQRELLKMLNTYWENREKSKNAELSSSITIMKSVHNNDEIISLKPLVTIETPKSVIKAKSKIEKGTHLADSSIRNVFSDIKSLLKEAVSKFKNNVPEKKSTKSQNVKSKPKAIQSVKPEMPVQAQKQEKEKVPMFSIAELKSDKYAPTNNKDKDIGRTKNNNLDL